MAERRLTSYVLGALGAVALVIAVGLARPTPAVATETGTSGSSNGATWASTRAVSLTMGEMMDRMHELMGTVSSMMGGMGATHGMMGGAHAMMGTNAANGPGSTPVMNGNQGMYGMMQGVDHLGSTMADTMRRMQSLMGDSQFMHDHRLAQSMRMMQNGMGTMMNGYQGLVNGMQALHGQSSSK